MSDVKIDIIAKVTGGAAQDLDKIATGFTGVETKTKSATAATKEWEAAGTKAAAAATRSWENTYKAVEKGANTIAHAGTVALTTAAAIAAATIAGAVANERQQRALTALGSAYGEVQRATNGTVTATEAWHTQQALLQTGLPTTGRELALITRAARDYAVATGTETPAAIEQLTQALTNGEAGGLRRFGLSVQQGATRTQTFNSALEQLQRTQANSTPTSRTLAEEVSHFGTTLTEAGGALAGFLAQSADVRTTMRLLGDSVHDAAGELRDLIELNQTHSTTGAVRGMIGGVRAPRRPVDPRTAEAQRIGEASTANALRAAQVATERANAPAAGGSSGPNLAERQDAALQQVEIRRRATAQEAIRLTAERKASEETLAAAVRAAEVAENERYNALKVALHETAEAHRTEQLAVVVALRERSQAESGLLEAQGRMSEADRERASNAREVQKALQEMLVASNARIEQLRTEHASQQDINNALRERIGIQQSLTTVTSELATTQRNNTAATREFADAMGSTGLSAVSAFADGLWAAVEAGESAGDAFLAVARAQLKALALEAVPQVFKNLALAAGAAFTNPAAVPSFLTAAGLWTAVGAVSGGIAAAIPAPAKAPTATGSGDRAASANAARAPSDSSGGGVTLNITVSGVATTHEGVQDAIVRSLDAAHARGVFLRQTRRD